MELQREGEPFASYKKGFMIVKGINCPQCQTFLEFPFAAATCPKCGTSVEKMAEEFEEQRRHSAQAAKKLRSEAKKLLTERRIPHTFRVTPEDLDRLRDISFARKARKEVVSDMSDILAEALREWFSRNSK